MLAGLVLVGVLWAGVVAWAAAHVRPRDCPGPGSRSQAAGAGPLLVLAAAASARRLGDLDEPGPGVAAAMTVLALLIHLLPGRLSLTGEPAATATLVRWTAVLAIAALALVLAVRDPAAPRPSRPPTGAAVRG